MADKKMYDEQQLIRQLKSGHKEAFRILYDMYKRKLYAYAYSFFRSKELSEEIVHDVFVKIWQKRFELKENCSFNSFIFTVTKNIIIDYTRRSAVEKIYLNHIKTGRSTASNQLEDEVIFAEYEKIAHEAIRQLPDKRREIFTLSREQHLSYHQIANQLNISPKTVEAQMNKALKFIKDYLYTHADITFSLTLYCLLNY